MSKRKIKVGVARVNKNSEELEIVINLKNGEAFTMKGYRISDLMRERVNFVDVFRKPCRRDRAK